MNTRLDRYKIKQKMKEADIGGELRDLAKVANVGEATIYRSVDSHRWSAKTLDAIANALKCNPLELLTVDIDPKVMALLMRQQMTTEQG